MLDRNVALEEAYVKERDLVFVRVAAYYWKLCNLREHFVASKYFPASFIVQ